MADYGELGRHIIYRCIVGSRAYGLETPESDTDRRGLYLPPAQMHWSLHGIPEQLESDEDQECYWELQKALTLALKANPTVLECFYSPLVEHVTLLAQDLLANRHRFLSRRIHDTLNGYVQSQFRLIQIQLQKTGRFKQKHAMHLIRLLVAGVKALQTGELMVRVDPETRPRLMAIRSGQMTWEEIDAWRVELHREFDRALAATALPEHPDVQWADRYLIRARRTAALESEEISCWTPD